MGFEPTLDAFLERCLYQKLGYVGSWACQGGPAPLYPLVVGSFPTVAELSCMSTPFYDEVINVPQTLTISYPNYEKIGIPALADYLGTDPALSTECEYTILLSFRSG